MELLKKLTLCYGPSGREDNIRKIIEDVAKPYADEIKTDALGNLIVHKKGSGKKIMVAAHMDEIGVIATVIDDNGFIRFSAVGGLYNKDLLGRRVVFENGVVGVIGSEEDNKDRKILKTVRIVSLISLLLTLSLIVLNILLVFAGETVGQTLNDILILVSAPMFCCYLRGLSPFLWACLFISSFPRMWKK